MVTLHKYLKTFKNKMQRIAIINRNDNNERIFEGTVKELQRNKKLKKRSFIALSSFQNNTLTTISVVLK